MKSVDDYVALMNGLNLSNPKMMDVAVPANMHQGLAQAEIARRGWAVTAQEALGLLGGRDVVLIDLRERSERERHGAIPGALHAPYPALQENIQPGGMLHELATATGKRLVFYCAFGERSAMAGAGRAGRWADNRVPHPRRYCGVEAGERGAGVGSARRAWVGAMRLAD